jgi:hypothetical protein
MAPANTGKLNNKRTAVMNTLQTNKGNLWYSIPCARMFIIVLIKLIAPAIDEIPAKCNEKIPKSTAPPEWAVAPESGG